MTTTQDLGYRDDPDWLDYCLEQGIDPEAPVEVEPEETPIFDRLAPHPHFALELAWNELARREMEEAFEHGPY